MGLSRLMDSPQARFAINYLLPAAALGIALFAAFYHLSESPAVWYDEGFFEQIAMNVARGGAQAMELAPGHYLSSWSMSAGYPLIYPIALSFIAFGKTVFAARLVPATYLVLFVIASYVFVRREHGPLVAGAAMLLLATFPLLYGNGKSVLGEVPALFWFMAGLLALQSFERSGARDVRLALAAGLALGLSFAAKFTFMLIAPAVLLVLIFRFRTLFARERRAAIVAGAIGFLLALLLWLFLQFGPGDSWQTTLAFFANPYDYGEQALGSIVLENLLRFFKEATPFYFLALFVPWGVAVFMRRRTVSLAELLSFCFSVFVVLAYLRTPGWYRYFFPAMTLALVFMPAAIVFLFDRIRERLPFLSRLKPLLVLGFAGLILLQGYQLAHSSYVASYYQSTRTAALAAYFSKVDPAKTVFLYNVPEVAVFLPSPSYYQFVMPHEDQPFGREALPLLAAGTPDLVIVNAETYQQDPSPFARYQVQDHVTHYVVLSRP